MAIQFINLEEVSFVEYSDELLEITSNTNTKESFLVTDAFHCY